MLPSETMIWQPEFTDKTLSRKPGAVHAAFLDGKSFEYKNGETNGETTKMTFFGPSGEVLKFLVNPVNNLYRMGLTSGATFEEINCTEI